MSKKMKLIIIIIEIIVLLGLSGYRVYEYINKDSNVNENNETVKKYKVTFDYGDNTVRSIEVEENEKIEFPDEPLKEGYIFDGWLLNSVVIDENYEVKEDITLKANWINENIDSEIKVLVYEINIRKEPDVNSTDIGDVHMDQVYGVLDIVETDTYTWYKIKKDNIVGYVANQKGEEWVEVKESEKNVKYYSVLVDEKNGTVIRTIRVKEGTKIILPESPSKKGYVFDGWTIENASIDENYIVNKDVVLKASWKQAIDNEDVSDKVLYFYEQDGNLYVDEENNNKNYIGSYQCKSDSCYGFSYMHNKYNAQLYNVNNNTSVVIDLNWFLYNYQEQKRISEYYNFFNDCGEYVSAKKEDKWVLLDYSGKELSKYYDFIGNYGYTKNVIEYENNNKHGLLSLKDGSKITEAIYDSVSIFQDNIVASIDDLEYVMAENGNIISKGYETVMWSNNELIVICENNLIDIIDYKGNSKINSKINAYGFDYSRTPVYTDVSGPRIVISTDNNNLKIEIPNPNEGYISIVYMYDMNNETLTIK